MKFDENGNIVQFEIGDVFDDTWGDEYEIIATTLRHWNVSGEREYHPWVLFKRVDQKELFTEDISTTWTWACDAVELQGEFENPYHGDNESSARDHFFKVKFKFKYNQIDELNKSFK